MTPFLSYAGMTALEPAMWDNLVPPTGVDPEILKNRILLATINFPVIYPDPIAFSAALDLWCKSRGPSWDKIQSALTADYNVVENYDRMEEITDRGTTTDKPNFQTTTTISGSATDTPGTTVSVDRKSTPGNTTVTTTPGTSTNTEAVAAMDSARLEPIKTTTTQTDAGTEKTEVGQGTDLTKTTSSGINKSTVNHTDTHVQSGSGITTTETSHKSRIHGNIGVTTAPDMISQEIKMRYDFDIYKIITEDFISEFCVPIYNI